MMDAGLIAAGEGSRLYRESIGVAKPLVEIGGLPMIGRIIKIMENASFDSISVIVNSEMPAVTGYLENLKTEVRVPLKWQLMKTPSSFHTFYELIKFMNPEGRFVVTTVDTIFKEGKFLDYVNEYKGVPEDIDGLFGVTSYIDDEKPLYVSTDRNHFITGFSDERNASDEISAGIYGLSPKIMPTLQNCYTNGVSRMRNFQRELIKSGLKIKAFDLGVVVDVDHIKDIDKANSLIADSFRLSSPY